MSKAGTTMLESAAMHREALRPQVLAYLAKVYQWATHSGFIAEMASRVVGRPTPNLRTANDVLAEKWLLTCGLLQAALTRDYSVIDFVGDGDANGKHDVAIACAATMLMSVSYLWRDQIRLASVREGGDLPPHIVQPDALPHPIMWWTWENDINTSTTPMKDDIDSGVGMLVSVVMDAPEYKTNAYQGYIFGKRNDGAVLVFASPIAEVGWQYPEDFHSAILLENYTNHAKMVGFLNSPFIDTTPLSPDRGMRRAVARYGSGPVRLDPVSIVTLRRKAGDDPREGIGEGASREYHWQWLVSGHWRNQWFPSRRGHQIRWIAPYRKGPDGAPLKVRMYDVKR